MTVVTKNRYNQRFTNQSSQGHKAFMPFTLLGWPDIEASFEIIKTMIESGATALELGLPFSDPVSDGPVIQQAACETLANGFRVSDGFELIKRARALDAEIPIGVMCYYNMVMARGLEKFVLDLAETGVDGVLIVDLPPEVAQEMYNITQKAGIQLIFIVSPLTTSERLKQMLTYAGGFLYVVSRLGITGTEERYDVELQSLLERIKGLTDLPVCVGFGISTPEQAQKILAQGADGVITGSRVIQIVQEPSSEPFVTRLAAFLKQMVAVCKIAP